MKLNCYNYIRTTLIAKETYNILST